MDFVRNRFFRQTLLCRSDVQLRRQLAASELTGLLLASPVTPAPGEPTSSFKTPDGRRVATEFPLTHAALSVLSEYWPVALDQPTLRALACERLASAPEGNELEQQWQIVLDDVLHCYANGAVELHTWQAPCTNRVSSEPRVSRLVAHQVRKGTVVTNQRHEMVPLDPVGKCLAAVVDGTRDRAALVAEVMARIATGELVLEEEGRPVTEKALSQQAAAMAVDQTLGSFARHALLVG
jgi:methyltransferase-like protein